mmetsp:Transcript_23829/g.52052  ORF Transcript_23829/g.52052 Transcript_23829/m.52052 type:complete len:141 (-) Transcript_23829:74-496(-)|eukprot:CAMPEP_0118956724 /NCGR_PEP_ID=MMETSP1169-20130426/61733_1 /TAXON_ID=36882 /ORGANISM="Pyramimonas obovata, Strain CCMP722" /LENGTH=140 /DNA_ID=CAMNT_0006904771 /DNA_START=77 /DNA_END=499 /DNA_ORIENTATION=+
MAAVMSMSGLKPLALRTQRVQTRRVAMPKVQGKGHKQVTKAFDDVNLTISACNATMLFLGRFAFLPYQRAQIAKAGLPVQNGETYEAAGDKYAKEASFLTATNDPAGFSLIDVMAWGSLGHALGFFALATGSNGYSAFGL